MLNDRVAELCTVWTTEASQPTRRVGVPTIYKFHVLFYAHSGPRNTSGIKVFKRDGHGIGDVIAPFLSLTGRQLSDQREVMRHETFSILSSHT